jgi:hypothetical protein
MRAKFVIVAAAIVALTFTAVAIAGSPHFIVSAFSFSQNGNTLTISAKEAGLGDETQINIVVTATAECINGGGKHPKAVNKAGVGAAATVPVQNGKAEYTLVVVAPEFQPPCDPPMTLRFSDITLTDTTNNLTKKF